MDYQTNDIANPSGNSSRLALVQVVLAALDHMTDASGPALLTFWSSRGGGKTFFLELLCRTLHSRADTVLLGMWDAGQTMVEQLMEEILTAVETAPQDRKQIVLIDNLDRLLHQDDGTPFFDFERRVIHHLVERGNVLTVITSRTEIGQWREFDVRARQENNRLPALNCAEVAGMASEWHLDPSSAYQRTLGHPQVLCWLGQEPSLSAEVLASRAGAYFLEDLSPEVRDLALITCLLPVFDIAVLRAAVSSTQIEAEGFYADYLERIRLLMSAGLVLWDIEAGAYRFTDAAVRCLLARSVQQSEPIRFEHVHRVAADYYMADARRAAFLHRSLISAIYHLAQMHRAEGPRGAGKQCLDWVQNNLGPWSGANWETVLRSWTTSGGDEVVAGELLELLGTDAFDRITRVIESAQAKLKS